MELYGNSIQIGLIATIVCRIFPRSVLLDREGGVADN
jgi:hypothetical protein